MADAVGDAATHDVQSLLSSPDRDFLVRNNGDRVELGSPSAFGFYRKEKGTVGLAYLLKLFSRCSSWVCLADDPFSCEWVLVLGDRVCLKNGAAGGWESCPSDSLWVLGFSGWKMRFLRLLEFEFRFSFWLFFAGSSWLWSCRFVMAKLADLVRDELIWSDLWFSFLSAIRWSPSRKWMIGDWCVTVWRKICA